MRSLIQHLVTNARLSVPSILVVGAGNGTELPALRKLGSKHLVLAEAHPRQAEDLAQRIDPARGEEVWPLAITATPAQQVTLQVMNNPRHSSLKAPGDLGKHFPNLHTINETQVPARSLGEAVESLGLDADGDNLLVLDAPGLAFELLDATGAKYLQSFGWIILGSSVVPLYANDHAREDSLTLLQSIGFEVGRDDADAVYPHSSILLKRDPTRVKLQRLQKELQQLREDHAAQAKLATERGTQVEALTKEHAEALADARQRAAADKAELDKIVQVAAAQQKLADAQIQTLTQERDEQAKLAAQYKSGLDKATQSAAEQQKLAADRQANIQKLTQEREEQAKLIALQKAEADKVAEVAAKQQKAASDLQAQILQLTQEHDATAKLLEQCQNELDKAKKMFVEMETLTAERKDLLDKVNLQNQARGARVIHLEKEHAELNRRQDWLNQEMTKAEAQVDLIKDVLLRDRAL